MKVHSLYLYPVKSLAGISVNSFDLDDFGPVGDRRWMIVDAVQKFVTQRSNPELAQVGTRLEGADVLVDIPGEGEFCLLPGTGSRNVRIWHDQVDAVAEARNASEALSRFCQKNVYFVYMPEKVFRRIDPLKVPDYRRVSFADGYPFLVTNTASLSELNGRLAAPVDMRRFRPNLVVEGAEPWSEDNWQALVIKGISLSLVKPCSRCIMTTVNPDTGARSADGQPLKTLASYRRTPEGVIFGANGIHHGRGMLAVGDSATIV